LQASYETAAAPCSLRRLRLTGVERSAAESSE
jgi:hypothetical protein